MPQPDKQLSFMLHELVFLGCHLQFASYPYMSASYSYSCEILQPYVGATVPIFSHPGTNAFLSGISGGSRRNVDQILDQKNLAKKKNEIFVHFHSNLDILTMFQKRCDSVCIRH